MNDLKDYIKSDIQDYMVSDYLYSKYSDPAQIIAYEDAYQIVEAISKGEFIEENEQAMLRKDKREKMFTMLKEKLSKKHKIIFEANETNVNDRTCPKLCVLF